MQSSLPSGRRDNPAQAAGRTSVGNLSRAEAEETVQLAAAYALDGTQVACRRFSTTF